MEARSGASPSDLWRTPAWWVTSEGQPRPLVMVTTSFPTGPRNIAGAFIDTLAGRLSSQGHRLSIVTPAGGARPGVGASPSGARVVRCGYPGWESAPFHRQGLPEALASAPVETLLRTTPAWWAMARAALGEARSLGSETLLVGHWLVPGGLIAQWVGRAGGFEATTICHSGAARLVARLPKRLGRPLARASLGSGGFVATCRELEVLLSETTGIDLSARAHISPMPVPAPARVGEAPSGGPLRVLTLGRLVPIKGLDLLIEALGEVDGVELQICGEGQARAGLEAQARRLGVSAVFHGLVCGRRKAALLSSCHAFALPSRRMPGGRTEGAPVALMEAMSYALPVLATRVGGVEEIVAGYPSAVLCEPDVASLRAGLRALALKASGA